MALVLTDESNYQNIAKSIRAKNGSTNTYTPEQMAEAIEAITTSGIDTSDANAIKTDIAANKTAYVDGQKITGTLSEITSEHTVTVPLNNGYGRVDGFVAKGKMDSDMIFRKDSSVEVNVPLEYFGTATESDVVLGKTFTSKEGYYKSGTAEPAPDLSDELFTQDSLIDQIVAALEGKTGTIINHTTVVEKDVNFYDYDGTLLYSYTADEALALNELPMLPAQEGLVCQGWNWSLSNIKTHVTECRICDIGATYITDDGKTRIYITLGEGRTSPMLGCCPNGTVTIDWGDGTEINVLTGTSTETILWTPTHNYVAAGDYVITLTVDGEVGFVGENTTYKYPHILSYSSEVDDRNAAYCYAIKSINLGYGVSNIGPYAFNCCKSVTSITIPNGITDIGDSSFSNCSALASIIIPDGVKNIDSYAFYQCYFLKNISIPCTIQSVPDLIFADCWSLARVVLPSVGRQIRIGVSVVSLFSSCLSLSSVFFPKSLSIIPTAAFKGCIGLTSVTLVGGSRILNSAFSGCVSVAYYDFSKRSAIPQLASPNAFDGIPADCEIRVPLALVDEWKAATNWSTYADYIVGV